MINSSGRRSAGSFPVSGWLRPLGRPALVGYGGGTEQLISLSVIVVGLLSYFIARYLQLGVRGTALWREAPAAAQPGRQAPKSGSQAAEGSQ